MSDSLRNAAHDVSSFAYGVAKFLVVDDWKKMTDSHAPAWERGLAAVSLASNFVGPEGRALSAVAKPVLMHAVESIAEHGAADGLKAMLEKGGVKELGEVARYLRSHASDVSGSVAKELEGVLKSPALQPLVTKANELGHNIVETGRFLENIVTKSSLLPSLRKLEGELEKSPAILAAAAFGQKNTIDTLLGNQAFPSLPDAVAGIKKLSSDMAGATVETYGMAKNAFHRAESFVIRSGEQIVNDTEQLFDQGLAAAGQTRQFVARHAQATIDNLAKPWPADFGPATRAWDGRSTVGPILRVENGWVEQNLGRETMAIRESDLKLGGQMLGAGEQLHIGRDGHATIEQPLQLTHGR